MPLWAYSSWKLVRSVETLINFLLCQIHTHSSVSQPTSAPCSNSQQRVLFVLVPHPYHENGKQLLTPEKPISLCSQNKTKNWYYYLGTHKNRCWLPWSWLQKQQVSSRIGFLHKHIAIYPGYCCGRREFSLLWNFWRVNCRGNSVKSWSRREMAESTRRCIVNGEVCCSSIEAKLCFYVRNSVHPALKNCASVK